MLSYVPLHYLTRKIVDPVVDFPRCDTYKYSNETYLNTQIFKVQSSIMAGI